MKIYTLAFCDIDYYGFGTKTITTFTNKENAISKMKEEYLEKCKKLGIENPMVEDSSENQITDDYAYILMAYYWDIFETEIEINLDNSKI